MKFDYVVVLIFDFGDVLFDFNVSGSGSGGSLMNFVSYSLIVVYEVDMLVKFKFGG